jgi:DNA-binding PadR family transcriptional regulator
MLEFIILGFLMHGDMSGYDIKRFMELSVSHFYDASFGSIYPMLKKMEELKTIDATEIIEEGKYKKVYSLTEEGRSQFFQWLERPIELNRSKHDYLIKIFFYGMLPAEKVRLLIGSFMEAIRQELEDLKSLEQRVSRQANFCEAATLDFGKSYYEFTLDWCEKFLERLNNPDSRKNIGAEKHENYCSERQPQG